MNRLSHDFSLDSTHAPTIDWFHGRLSRREAEQRLQVFGLKMNSYLVRESDRKPGSYVLSFVSPKTGLNHFRILNICGDFYIGGKSFHSLQQLIDYYTHCSDLLKNERLEYPVPNYDPITPINRVRRMVAILPYSKMPETDELSFKKGDIFVVQNDLNDGWLWVTNHRTLESGLVFSDLLEELDENTDENEIYPWFHSKISKEEAVDKLARAGPGSFLVRPSDNSPGNYSLFFHVENSVQRFRIERKGNRYFMGGRVFPSLEAVVQRYKDEQIVEGFRLLVPVIKHAIGEQRWTQRDAEELHARTQDVYQTLRESRELAKKNQSIKMKGFLNKKSQKHVKKWKQLYFVLNTKESILYFYESPRRTRPKGVVDLSYSYLYLVHDSLFDKQFCFQLVERALPCISTIYYLSANDSETSQQWIHALKPCCLPQLKVIQPTSDGTDQQLNRSGVREVRSLFLTLLEANHLSVKLCPHPFLTISLNNVRVGKTGVKCPPDPIWEEDFVLEDIPSDIQSFTLTLLNKGKRQKDVEIAETTIELSKLNSGEEFEQWFQLSGLCPPIREDWGSIRARVRFVHEIIMPFDEYSTLKDLLLSFDDLECISLIEDFCLSFDAKTNLANSLLKISRFDRKECLLLKAMIEREIKLESEVSTLFRANSLTTSLIDQYMKGCCHQFIQKSLHDPINKVMDSKASCELNPAKLDSPSEACANAEHLLNLLDMIVDSIFKHVNECPINLRLICGSLQRAVQKKWPNDQLVRSRVVGGFIFLRLICPAILNPRQFNLVNDTPSETASRSLILIAKSLQNLANLVEFGTKSIFITKDRFEPPPPPNSKREPWMEIVNPFILKNKMRMINYLDELSLNGQHNMNQIPVKNQQDDDNIFINSEPSRELATIHSICEIHKQEIQQFSQNRTMLKKLSTVIEMLTKHKQRYQDLIQP